VIEAAVIEDDRLSLTLSGEFDVACRLCGSSKVFAAGTTSVASNLTGSLTIDATHNQQVEQISLSLVPAHGSVAATPDYWHQDDITRREWTEWVSMQGIRVGHEAGDLQPAAGYMLMEDGCLVDSLYSDQSGVVTFTRTPPCSAASYQLLMDSSFARVDPEGQGPGRDEPSVTSLQIVTRPNPFGHGTTLSYQLPGDTEVTLGIYTVSGTLVRSLVDRRVEAGRHSVKWDCRDNRGSVVSAGVYVCRLTTPGRLKTCKLVVFR
jgi:hypothetical protein